MTPKCFYASLVEYWHKVVPFSKTGSPKGRYGDEECATSVDAFLEYLDDVVEWISAKPCPNLRFGTVLAYTGPAGLFIRTVLCLPKSRSL